MVRATSSTSSSSHSSDIKPIITSSKKGNAVKWTGEERRLLFTYVEKNGIGSWNGASAFVPGKSAKQCRDQWMKKLSPALLKLCDAA